MPKKPAQILIVDDSREMCRAMVRIASHFGRTAHFVESGQAALDDLDRHLPELVLLDLMMPGITGLDVLRTIRANSRTKSLPVIIHSAISEPSRIVISRDQSLWSLAVTLMVCLPASTVSLQGVLPANSLSM